MTEAPSRERLERKIDELSCLFGICRLAETPRVSLDDICNGAAELIAASFRRPGMSGVRIILDGREYGTGPFPETDLTYAGCIMLNQAPAGKLEIGFSGAPSDDRAAEALKRDAEMIDAVAAQLSRIIDAWQTEEVLKKYHDQLEQQMLDANEELKREIEIRKKTEKALRESEEKYRTILDSIEDGYYEVDLSGNLILFNDAMCKILEYPASALQGAHVQDFMDPNNAARAFDAFKTVTRTGTPEKGFEFEMRTGAGLKNVEISISLIRGTGGAPAGFRGILRDISDRKRADALEKEKITADEANRAKSQFLANMSHEIRTPLNAIIGLSELMTETELDDRQRQLIHTINTETNSLISIINDILDFSKIEAQKVELEAIPFNLRYLLEDIAGSIGFEAEKKGLEFISYLPMAVPSRLVGDPGRLRQVLMNLACNALKFTERGEIFIKAELLENLGDRVLLKFSVRDTGIGIPREKQSAIFDIFTQADGSTTRIYGGTGLGTSISKRLVELMDGEIGLESEPGRGSVFWFTATFVRQPAAEPEEPARTIDLNGRRVMVLDDNPTSRRVMTEYLACWGCRVTPAADLTEAISALKRRKTAAEPDILILTDSRMPYRDCLDTAREIKGVRGLEQVPMIALTGAGKIGDGRRCREIGVACYLTKPVKAEALHKAIASMLGLPGAPDKAAGAKRPVTRHTVFEQERKPVHILLVEDYPTNQKVIALHLEGAGHHVDVAGDGRQAVRCFRQKCYDLILMDVQMPVMDGYEATMAIRRLEADLVRENAGRDVLAWRRTPILAMTAHAMKNYKDRCLEAGMDDYIAKPIKRDRLLATVRRWTGEKIGPEEKRRAVMETKHAGGTPPMDYDRAVAEFLDDEDIVVETLRFFVDDVKRQLDALRRALNEGDADMIGQTAHKIKGGAGNLTADHMADIAGHLEQLGKSGDLKDAAKILDALETEYERFRAHVLNLPAFANDRENETADHCCACGNEHTGDIP